MKHFRDRYNERSFYLLLGSFGLLLKVFLVKKNRSNLEY